MTKERTNADRVRIDREATRSRFILGDRNFKGRTRADDSNGSEGASRDDPSDDESIAQSANINVNFNDRKEMFLFLRERKDRDVTARNYIFLLYVYHLFDYYLQNVDRAKALLRDRRIDDEILFCVIYFCVYFNFYSCVDIIIFLHYSPTINCIYVHLVSKSVIRMRERENAREREKMIKERVHRAAASGLADG